MIVARFGMSEECVRWVTGRFFLNDSGLSVHSRKLTNLSQRFLGMQLLARQKEIYRLGRGTAQKNLNVAAFHGLRIIVPPLEEQRRIVAVLDEAFEGLDRARAHAEANLNNASELFEIVVDQAFPGDEWPTTELGKIVHNECSLSYGIVQPGDEVIGGLPIVRPTDMTKRVIDLDGLKKIDPNRAASYKRTALVGGELLVCVRGTTGTVSIANDKLSGANVTRGIVPIRFDRSKFNTWFAYYQFRSKYIREQIKEKTYGAALMQINIRDIRKISVLWPSLEEQNSVAKKLDSVLRSYDQLCRELRAKRSDIADLRQSLLQRAFAGELT